jgi:hypothetical protein
MVKKKMQSMAMDLDRKITEEPQPRYLEDWVTGSKKTSKLDEQELE